MNIREMRSNLGRLDELLDEIGEILITKNNQPIAKVVPVKPRKPLPSNEGLWAMQGHSPVSSAQLVREDRDAR
ncbi:MAG: type II toxin-antitoxin system prevent-host-death family antitoxin [Methyloglobulus sp.]|nr:type II toxin-antitoxin system prevent-host-death family antitoxin [Methyloglobulus sp.]